MSIVINLTYSRQHCQAVSKGKMMQVHIARNHVFCYHITFIGIYLL